MKYMMKARRTMSAEFKHKPNPQLLHAALGLSTEAGEFEDALKRHIFYGEALDETNLVEELGDILFYVAMAALELGVSFDRIQHLNIAKLQERYPERFAAEAALDRDVDAERKALTP